jgi:hypothetical protein
MSGFSAAQAIISAMITPALLILAAGSHIATALVRLARVVDRVRKLAEGGEPSMPPDVLHRHERRALLAERALQNFFFAVVCFVMAGIALGIDHFAADRLTWLPVVLTLVGMCLIVAGSAAMLSECKLATAERQAEIKVLVMKTSDLN